MNTSTIFVIISISLLFIDVIIIGRIIRNKYHYEKITRILERNKKIFLKAILGKYIDGIRKLPIYNYFNMKQYMRLDEEKSKRIENIIDINNIEKKYLRGQKSIFKTKRIEAITNLGLLRTEKARVALEKDLLLEKDFTIKIYIANALADIGEKESIPVMTKSLLNGEHFYRERVNMLIAGFGKDFNDYLPEIILSDKTEIKELIVDFASVYFSEKAKEYILQLINNKDEEIEKIRRLYGIKNHNSAKEEESFRKLIYKALDILVEYYPIELDKDEYLFAEDDEIRKRAIKALSNLDPREKIDKVKILLRDEKTMKFALDTISIIIDKYPDFITEVAKSFIIEKDIRLKKEFAMILSRRIEYFIIMLLKKKTKNASEIIKEILFLGINSEVIDFLNKNENKDIENELVSIIREVITNSVDQEGDFRRYLDERILRKCGLAVIEEVDTKKIEIKDKKLIKKLYILLVVVILIFPIIYCIIHREILHELSLIEHVEIYVIDFNYYFAYYSITISCIYVLLLIFSYINVKRQSKLWKIKNISLLFKKKMLPSVSIISPAYNEENNIIESVNSLLDQKYPDYELIIVNDGSKDNTLGMLIKYFKLSKVNYSFDYKIKTKQVKGVYMNLSMPKIIVVDKENGGKADSLNVGINISRKRYFCCIDADCLLEDDSLLKLASITLDTGVETPAIGGNVFPINGCTIEKGQIKNKRIPKNNLARFQTVEYIRAFMGGRLGWAYIKSLLIISGAFGLFRKERVIQVGGYLTSRGIYGKDTMAEDMELIVRISRFMRENHKKYKIAYSFNADCWTEVPENLKSLKNQRIRWQEGLIDIIGFHKKMILNPKYGKIGALAMPYYFIFEVIGPIIEAEGYLMVILAIVFKIINNKIILLLFISNILLGIFISVASVLLVERDKKNFTLKDILILIGYSIIENLGPRQLLSIWRVVGYIQMLKKPKGWQKGKRKGFVNAN